MPGWPFVCILPSRMKQNLRIEDKDVGSAYVSVLGRRLRVVGTFKSDELFKFEDMDGEEITPVDFVAQQYKQAGGAGAQAGGGLALSATGQMDVASFVSQRSAKQQEEEQYIHMEPDRVLIVPNELNLKLGGQVRSIAAGPGVTTEAQAVLHPFQGTLKELLSRVNLALYAGYPDNPGGKPVVHRVATRSRLGIGGVQGLLVPILIAALIVFNTMLGAVYERMYEIKTYASVGLAPMHIAALFFAESSVFAVMGAMLGYLIGQIISRGLMMVPGLMAGMSLNYSSISAVWSALLVVVVVLLSTAYPARMAGKLSVPDETRKMTIPKPTTDVWEIWFPFTVSSKEALGVMSYLREYFESNDEDAVGSFTSDNLRFYVEEVEGRRHVCLGADVWVAPLDMGVSQAVKISAIPDPEEGQITYLFFTITRKSGEFQTWHRMNLGFLKDLRKQLLIWRLVTPEAKKRLTKEGNELLERELAQASQAGGLNPGGPAAAHRIRRAQPRASNGPGRRLSKITRGAGRDHRVRRGVRHKSRARGAFRRAGGAARLDVHVADARPAVGHARCLGHPHHLPGDRETLPHQADAPGDVHHLERDLRRARLRHGPGHELHLDAVLRA